MILKAFNKLTGRGHRGVSADTVPIFEGRIASAEPDSQESYTEKADPYAISPVSGGEEKKPTENHDTAMLGLSSRPYNALRRAGVTTLAKLRNLTDDDLLKIRCLGLSSLAEIKDKLSPEYLSGLDLTSAVGGQEEADKREYASVPTSRLVGEQMTLALAKPSPESSFSRFPELASRLCSVFENQGLLDELCLPPQAKNNLHQATGEEIETLADLQILLKVGKLRREPLNQYWQTLTGKHAANRVKGALQKVMDWLEKVLTYDSLDDEVGDLVDHLSDRERLILISRFGTEKRLTLEEIGHQLGITRERVRQLENKAQKKLTNQIVKSSLFYSTGAVILLKRMGEDATLNSWKQQLMDIGFLKEASSLNLLIAISSATETPKLALSEELWQLLKTGVSPRILAARKPVLDKARRFCRNSGAIRLTSLVNDELSEVDAERILRSHGFTEVHPGWWVTEVGKYAPERVARKVIAYCGPVSPPTMRHALRRHLSRLQFPTPPSEVLVRILEHTGHFALVDGLLQSSEMPAKKPRLTGPESVFIGLAQIEGPLLSFELIHRSLINEGFSTAAVSQLLSRSPIVQKVAAGLYILLGSRYDSTDIERANFQLRRVSANYSMKPRSDGVIEFEANVGPWMVYGGVLSSGPAARMKGTWTIIVDGTNQEELIIESGFVRGLKKASESLGIVPGDRIRIEFNTWNREAIITKVANNE